MIRVLVADDHEGLRRGVVAHLNEQPGLAVTGEADNAHDVLSIVASQTFDTALIDLQMPPRAGAETALVGVDLIRQLRGRFGSLKILAYSGFLDLEDSCVGAGADRFLDKGADLGDLVVQIRRLAIGLNTESRPRRKTGRTVHQEVAQYCQSEVGGPDCKAPWDVARLLEALNLRLFDYQLSIATLLADCGITDKNVSTRFRFFVGRSPRQYVSWHRLRLAERLLCQTSATCSEIAFGCGFSSESSFSSFFRRHIGKRPSETRG